MCVNESDWLRWLQSLLARFHSANENLRHFKVYSQKPEHCERPWDLFTNLSAMSILND